METKDIYPKSCLRYFTDGVNLVTGICNKMKNSLISMNEKVALRKRSVIETVNDELKNISQIKHSRHRPFISFLFNILAGLAVYSFFSKKQSIKSNCKNLINCRHFNHRAGQNALVEDPKMEIFLWFFRYGRNQ